MMGSSVVANWHCNGVPDPMKAWPDQELALRRCFSRSSGVATADGRPELADRRQVRKAFITHAVRLVQRKAAGVRPEGASRPKDPGSRLHFPAPDKGLAVGR